MDFELIFDTLTHKNRLQNAGKGLENFWIFKASLPNIEWDSAYRNKGGGKEKRDTDLLGSANLAGIWLIGSTAFWSLHDNSNNKGSIQLT